MKLLEGIGHGLFRGAAVVIGMSAFLLAIAQPAQAEQTDLSYYGVFDHVDDPHGLLNPQLKVGTGFRVILTFDPENAIDAPLNDEGLRWFVMEDNPALLLFFGTGWMAFDQTLHVVIGNDLGAEFGGSGLDYWGVWDWGPQELAVTFGYSDPTGSALANAGLTVPSDSDFTDWRDVVLGVRYRGVGGTQASATGTVYPVPSGGKVVCWGGDNLGQASPPSSLDGTDGYARAIGAGFGHTCASQAGTWRTVCWGADDFGQASPPLSDIGTVLSSQAIAGGGGHTCAIIGGSWGEYVECWGANDFGQAAPPDLVSGALPGDAIDNARAVATGSFHSCAIQSGTDAAVCWGRNDFGEATPPAGVDGSDGSASSIAVGYAHSCAVQTGTGNVLCWGRDDFGESSPPDSVNGTTGTAIAIAAGDSHTCAIQADTEIVVCWGNDTNGRITPPSSVSTTEGGASIIAAGDSHTCAIQSGNDRVVCWGSNSSGQAVVPGAVNGTGGTAFALAAGADHSCAIQSPDLDGIPVEIEQAAPNGGDGNADGFPDAEQTEVVSLPDVGGEDYVTLEVSEGCPSASHVSVSPEVVDDQLWSGGAFIPQRAADPEHDYPFGLVGFTLPCPGPAVVKLYFHGVEQLSPPYRKYGPTIPGDQETVAWYSMPNVVFGSEIVDGNPVATVQYTLRDGEPGDWTGVDGRIVDPGGPVPEPHFVLSLLSGVVLLHHLARRRKP